MPVYTFKCLSCNQIKDVLQKMKDTNPICERCADSSCGVHIVEMKRQFNKDMSFQLKGDGWHKDGYSTPIKSEKPK